MMGVIIPDQTFWAVCGFFYVLDNVRRLGGRELILSEGFDGRWSPVFPLYRYRLWGKSLSILNLFLPALVAFRMPWLTHTPFKRQDMRRSLHLLHFYRKQLRPFRVLSATLFIVFFIAGPVATHYLGLVYTLTFLLPFYILALLLLLCLLIITRRSWRMEWAQLGGLVIECAVCPGYFINVCRRLSLDYARVPGDGLAYALVFGGPTTATQIGLMLDHWLAELGESDELRPEDEPVIGAYRHYLAEPNTND